MSFQVVDYACQVTQILLQGNHAVFLETCGHFCIGNNGGALPTGGVQCHVCADTHQQTWCRICQLSKEA